MSDVRHTTDEDESLQLIWEMYNKVIPSSPLAVNIDEMCVLNIPSLKFHDFDVVPVKMKMNNNGRTVTLCGTWSTDQWPSISGSSFVNRYSFSHLHFHWTESDVVGSEHIINGKVHAMEMHLIFFKKSCKQIFETKSQQIECVTLAYLFDISPNKNLGIDHITKQLDSIQEYKQTTKIPAFPLSHLLDNTDRSDEYFTYVGKSAKRSDKCNISQWIVFTKANDISYEQLNRFRLVLNKRGRPIKRNCRAATVASGAGAAYLVPAVSSDERDRSGGHCRDAKSKDCGDRRPVGAITSRGNLTYKYNRTHVLRCKSTGGKITGQLRPTTAAAAAAAAAARLQRSEPPPHEANADKTDGPTKIAGSNRPPWY